MGGFIGRDGLWEGEKEEEKEKKPSLNFWSSSLHLLGAITFGLWALENKTKA